MKKPNVILINCDDLGYGDLSCYGSKLNKTPVLDKLAEDGMKFTDFYMASSVCSPSRGAMMTGCYPPRIGFGAFEETKWVLMPGYSEGLNSEEITIAQILKDAGYKTKLVGKWHCGDQEEFMPLNHGFDSYYGLPYSNDMGMSEKRKGKYPPLPLIKDSEVIQEQPDQASLTERYVEEAVSFMRENKENSFFLYFAHMYVHQPLFVPESFMKNSDNGSYGAAVECIDWATDAILYELEKLGLTEDTLIIFTSDNGANKFGINSPLRGGKGSTWEGGQRVPCIMRWPGKIPAGAVCSELASAMDFYPTLTKLCGGVLPQDRIIDGKDIDSLMFAECDAKSPHEAFFYYKSNTLEAVRCGKWKLHVYKRPGKYNPEFSEEFVINALYNLEDDIAEENNLYDQHPEIVNELAEKIANCRKDIGDDISNIIGENIRPVGKVDNPDTLTHYDPEHPYIVAMYD